MPGPNRKVQSRTATRALAVVVSVVGVGAGQVLAQGVDGQDGEDAGEDDRRLERPGGDEAGGSAGPVALDDRVEGDGGADTGEPGEDLEQPAPEDAAVAADAEDPVRVVDDAAVEPEGGDREHEGGDVEEPGGECGLAVGVHRRRGWCDVVVIMGQFPSGCVRSGRSVSESSTGVSEISGMPMSRSAGGVRAVRPGRRPIPG